MRNKHSDRTPTRGLLRAVLVGLLLAVLSGCDREAGPEDAGLGVERFTDVVVELRQAERDLVASDSPEGAFDRRKSEILAEHDVTEEELREFLRSRTDPAVLERLWDTVNVRLRGAPVDGDSAGEDPDEEP